MALGVIGIVATVLFFSGIYLGLVLAGPSGCSSTPSR